MGLSFRKCARYASVVGWDGQGDRVIIPAYWGGVPVTEIAAGAFQDQRRLRSVTLPPALETIETGAFHGCRALEWVGVEDGTDQSRRISRFPAALRVIREYAFAGTGLEYLVFTSPELQIRDSAFRDCAELKTVSCPVEARVELGVASFMASGLTQFRMPRVELNVVPDYCFADCRALRSVKLAGIGLADLWSFWDCGNLRNLKLRKPLQAVGAYAFQGVRRLNLLKLVDSGTEVTEQLREELGRMRWRQPVSMHLCRLLRHEPELVGLQVDAEGWADLDELVRKVKKYSLTRELVQEIVETDDKGRYRISPDGNRIKCCQGHSIDWVKPRLEVREPPEFLYHGTTAKAWGLIQGSGGIQKMGRHHVHLHDDEDMAWNSANRRKQEKGVVLVIAAKEMHDAGMAFLTSENEIWFTEEVPVSYIWEVRREEW